MHSGNNLTNVWPHEADFYTDC